MKLKFKLLATASFFLLSGCVNTNNLAMQNVLNIAQNNNTQPTVINSSYNQNNNLNNSSSPFTLGIYIDNPILNVEIDTVLAEELATVIKMNNLIVNNMPISIEDKWPELLKDYQDYSKNKEMKKFENEKKEYDEYLISLLKNDYSFYKYYDPDNIRKQIKSLAGLALIAHPSAMKKIVVLKIIQKYGLNIEHLKNVISYKPLGCGVPYYNPKFASMFKPVKKSLCEEIDKKLSKQCEFFSKSLEDIIYKYEDKFYSLKVGANCLKAVEGKTYPSFRTAFYSLMADDLRNKIKQMDDELRNVHIKIAHLKSDIKIAEAKKENENKILVLKKSLKKLEKEKDNIESIRDKLYEEAKNRIIVDKEKVKLALKLKILVDYIKSNLVNVGVGTTVLSINTFLDVKELLNLGPKADNAIELTVLVYMADNKLLDKNEAVNIAKKRLALLLKRAALLPKNVFIIVYGIGAQISMLSDYTDYLDAVINAGKKAKIIKE
jgi:hypothetical protein